MRRLFLAPILTGAALALLPALPTQAAEVLVVEHTADEADGHAPWSLRDRVSQAKEGDTIQLRPETVYVLSRCDATQLNENANKGGDLDVVPNTVTIAGSKSVIAQVCPAQDGLIDHLGHGTLTVRSVRLTAGNSQGRGGAIRSKGSVKLESANVDHNRSLGGGGGIWADGNVTAQDAKIINNLIGNVGGDGGGIRAGGSVTITNSTVAHNGGSVQHGGGVRAEGNVSVQKSKITDNEASQGGGGLSAHGKVTFADTQVEDNTSGRDGGGIEADVVDGKSSSIINNDAGLDQVDGTGGGIFAATEANLDRVVVRQNTSLLRGGGVAVPLLTVETITATITDSTFEQNISMAAAGGGLFVNTGASIDGSTFAQNIAATIGGGFTGGFANVVNSTFSNNQAGTRGGGAAGLRLDLDFVTMDRNVAPEGAHISVIGDQFKPFATTFTGSGSPGCVLFGGATQTQGFNLVDDGDNSCKLGNKDFLNVGPAQFGPLAKNGGSTATLLPAATSPVVNRISAAEPACAGSDQRNAPRPNGTKCDIGAVER